MMDKVSVEQTMFMQLAWAAENKQYDAILPFHIKYEFLMKDRRGFQMQMGWTQDIKAEFLNLEFGLDICAPVSKDGSPIEIQSSDDDDEEDEQVEKPINYNQFAKLLCPLQPLLNQQLQERYYDVFFSRLTLSGHILKYYGSDN